jgi:hypothetical protein
VNLDEYINTFIYEGLKYLGVRFWIKDEELAFKYPEIISGNTKDLFKLIKDHEQILKAKVENEPRRFYREF